LSEDEPIRLALEVDDEGLANRLMTLLTDVRGLEVVPRGQPADVTVTSGQSDAPPTNRDVVLTPREVEVLALLAEGASNKTIARHLGISVHTAKFHVGSLIDKLDAVGRTDVVAHAARLGVIRL
jgi:DNA-binding CsgD family transcriptional regulator